MVALGRRSGRRRRRGRRGPGDRTTWRSTGRRCRRGGKTFRPRGHRSPALARRIGRPRSQRCRAAGRSPRSLSSLPPTAATATLPSCNVSALWVARCGRRCPSVSSGFLCFSFRSGSSRPSGSVPLLLWPNSGRVI